MMFSEKTLYGAQGELQNEDRIKVNLVDGTIIEGIVSSFNHGGAYVGSYFVGWERVSELGILHRPSEEEKFTIKVTRTIQQTSNYRGGGRTLREMIPTTERVIAMVREYDAKHSDTKAEPTHVIWERDPVRTATPAHQDRVDAG